VEKKEVLAEDNIKELVLSLAHSLSTEQGKLKMKCANDKTNKKISEINKKIKLNKNVLLKYITI